jgi:hypothetical protein
MASPALPVSTPSQGAVYPLAPHAQPSSASGAPALQSFVAAMTQPDTAPMPQAAMQPVQLPEAPRATAPMQNAAAAASPSHLMAAPLQQGMPAVQPSTQAATPSSAAPAAF